MANKKTTWFERAIFLSWYCAKGDCKFCYMSTQKNLIKDPKNARRSFESILAEAFLCKKFGWKIEFLSGGYESFSKKDMLFLIKHIYNICKERLWLNMGVLNKEELKLFKPYIQGVCGAVECVNPKVHKEICPSKPIKEIEKMFKACDELKLKKAITIILGIGEKEKDIPLLKKFIKKNKVDKITFYRLKPQKNTIFENKKTITKEYYVKWVKEIRKEFPKIKITIGSWLNNLDEIHLLLNAGADAVTKFPSIKLFNSKYAKKIEKEAKKAGRKFKGTLTEMKKINIDEIDEFKIKRARKNETFFVPQKSSISMKLKKKIKIKLREYIKKMEK
ncbi:radical SAM protein [Candidatus Woesearchaeota archaeon]|nr:radical SAM protein [Candidatus Woesearchaeota archaeon]